MCPRRGVTRLSRPDTRSDPDVRVLLYCFKPPSPRAAASPPPRQAVGAFGPCSRTIHERSDPDPLRGGPRRIQAGRWSGRPHPLWNSSRSPDAALKGPLRRPPAALDRCLSAVSPLAPYGTMGAGV